MVYCQELLCVMIRQKESYKIKTNAKRKSSVKKKLGSSRHGSAETNLTSNHEDVYSTPGLDQWARDLALPRAEVQATDTAQIQSCCGCGVGRWLQLPFDPQPGNLYMLGVRPLKMQQHKEGVGEKMIWTRNAK